VTGPSSLKARWEHSSLRAVLASCYRWGRFLPERLAHSSRRDRAITALCMAPAPRRVLYICLGNVCRSPYAEVASRRDASDWGTNPPTWHSAGFIGPDRPAPPFALDVATARGAPLDTHRSQVASQPLVDESDLIVVMEAYQASELALRFGRRRNVVVLGDFDPMPISTRTIRDPWNRERDDFERSYERIDRCLGVLAKTIRKLPSS